MKLITSVFALLFLFSANVEAQEKKDPQPKPGRYIQTEVKETKADLCWGSGRRYPLKIQVTSVDVLNKKEMRVNLIISNTKDKPCRICPNVLKENPIYIIDEKVTKYRPIRQLEADWNKNPRNKKEHILAPTEKVKGKIIFPLIVEGAKRFDLYIGPEAQPIKNIELID